MTRFRYHLQAKDNDEQHDPPYKLYKQRSNNFIKLKMSAFSNPETKSLFSVTYKSEATTYKAWMEEITRLERFHHAHVYDEAQKRNADLDSSVNVMVLIVAQNNFRLNSIAGKIREGNRPLVEAHDKHRLLFNNLKELRNKHVPEFQTLLNEKVKLSTRFTELQERVQTAKDKMKSLEEEHPWILERSTSSQRAPTQSKNLRQLAVLMTVDAMFL
ncbi:hypothetical protein Tco_0958777 [Tanacetum coccineum]